MINKWILLVVMMLLAKAESRCESDIRCTIIRGMQPINEIDEIINICRQFEGNLTVADPQPSSNVMGLEKLNGTCRRYTDVMAFKHQFQKQISSELSDNQLLSITTLIMNFQMAAMKLQNMEIELTKRCSTCKRFTSKEYDSIFFSRLNVEEDLVSSLSCIAATIWQNQTDLCDEWDNYDIVNMTCSYI